MRLSQFWLNTQKEIPAEAEVISHQLMLRSGMIRQLALGTYAWMPLGLRVLRKVEGIVREEMDRAGAIELSMPMVQPAELWQESGRWQAYGPELLRFQDRHERSYCLGPTHEEVITDLLRRDLNSYKQLPVCLYQIQNKFRDEIRPRFGVMRGREFLMKDAYSFHADLASLQQTYQAMYDAYSRILNRLDLKFRAVEADTGSIGGFASHEFQVLADTGEDAIVISTGSDYAANIELAPTQPQALAVPTTDAAMEKVATPNVGSIDELCAFLKVSAQQTLKTLLVDGENDSLVALVLRGDHELNAVKAEKIPQVAKPLRMADAGKIERILGARIGSIGPVGLRIPLVVDYAAGAVQDFICGANETGYHLVHVCWGRDLPEPERADLRNITAGEPSPDGKGEVKIVRGIEVGHIFQLGDKYSKSMQLSVPDEDGAALTPLMGCYGIGVSRLVAAAIEQNHDERGIIWSRALAPFSLAILPLNAHQDENVKTQAEALYQSFLQKGVEVVFDDRDRRPGVMFADMDLIGIPHRIVVSQRSLAQNCVEYKNRCHEETELLPLDGLIERLLERLQD